MEQSLKDAIASFEEKVERTIYIDNLSPQVTKSVLETAFGQFGTVTNVQFMPTHFASCCVYAALVEMQSVKQAVDIVGEVNDSPFMISGMPRPVRAKKACAEMFGDRPQKRDKPIVCSWMDPSDPKFEAAKKFKELTKRHAAEAAFLMEQQLADEEKLHKQQNETLKANYRKYDLIDGAQGNGTIKNLQDYYKPKRNDN
ncbi:ASI1-immunoprecipitated protein 1-like [Rutidosis leptorrhynchoides]|uniref:ASI1-immunoprecipitated protein 1-like n=1 Tax=Rutidosis leptorrhynchoides TaxID=125765 RepID=UPI003A992A09